jgi:hypothetical protein
LAEGIFPSAQEVLEMTCWLCLIMNVGYR